jgi:phosphomannomutase
MALMISVSGIRGLVGETLTPTVVLQFAQAYGTVLEGGRVALGRDTRPSGEMYAAAATAGLVASGCAVTDLGVVMTPTIGHAIRKQGFSGGLLITASHNPGEWNGLKFLDDQGLAPDPERVARITEIRQSGSQHNITENFLPVASDDTAGERHAEAVQHAIEVDLTPLKGMRVLLDSVNGAGCAVSPEMLMSMGCDVVHVNGEPSGLFAHPPEPIVENLGETCHAVRESGAAVGFVQDPDADRLALIDEQGQFIGEEYTLALAVESVLSRRPGPVAANLSTSRLVDAVAQKYGVNVVRTPVGEAHVARGLFSNEGVIGGEGNGGVIDPRISPVRDSLAAMSLILQLMATSGQSISELVAQLPRYAMIKEKAPCSREKIASAIEAASRTFASETLNKSDGVRIDFEAGWVHLRGSNTEPIVRVIGEAEDETTARRLLDEVKAAAELS